MSYQNGTPAQKEDIRYIRQAMSAPLLERDEEIALLKSWQTKGSEKALHKIINTHARLVIAIAKKFKNYGLPMNDLIQEGHIGLLEAAARFDLSRDNRFSTYASWWVRAQIQDYVLRNWSIVRTGTTASHKSLFFNLRRLRAKLEGQAQRDWLDDGAIDDIAAELGVSEKDVRAMEARINTGDQSLNTPVGDSEKVSLIDLMEDTDSPTPEDIVIGMRDSASRSEWLNDALSHLSTREQKIIRDRQMNDDVVTLDALGKELGISKERVRQIEKSAMDKLKGFLVETAGKDDLDDVKVLTSQHSYEYQQAQT